ncbi:MAG: M20/M25/M40 family metallo-hydrolase [Geminicoccaceae bacterium]
MFSAEGREQTLFPCPGSTWRREKRQGNSAGEGRGGRPNTRDRRDQVARDGSERVVGRVSLDDEDELGRILTACMPDAEIVETTMASIRLESHRSAPGHETAVAEFLHRLLDAEGIETELRPVRPGRPNVVGTLRGTAGGPRLMFNGHTDTVPPGTMADPFTPRIVDGEITGRGSCDMKGGLVAQACAMIALKRAGIRLGGDLLFTGAIAEEDATNLGSLDVVQNGPAADMVIVAEPTNLQVAVAHKGFDYYRIDVPGIAGHSSRPEKATNAVYRAAAVVKAVEHELAPELRAAPTPGRAGHHQRLVDHRLRPERGGHRVRRRAAAQAGRRDGARHLHRHPRSSPPARQRARYDAGAAAGAGGGGGRRRTGGDRPFHPGLPGARLPSAAGYRPRPRAGARMPAAGRAAGRRRRRAGRRAVLVGRGAVQRRLEGAGDRLRAGRHRPWPTRTTSASRSPSCCRRRGSTRCSPPRCSGSSDDRRP